MRKRKKELVFVEFWSLSQYLWKFQSIIKKKERKRKKDPNKWLC